MNTYQKLVRDRIPEIIRSNSEEPITTQLDRKEFIAALFEKLLEEAHEVVDAEEKQEYEKEIGDVREVLRALVAVLDLDMERIQKLQEKRRKERGGFEKGIYLEDVNEKE